MPLDLSQYFFYADRPILRLRISTQDEAQSTIVSAQIDTGADISVFDADIAERLEIDLKSAATQAVQGINGEVSQARLANVVLALLDDPDVGVTLNVAFMENLNRQNLGNLIGLDVLAHFDFGLSPRRPNRVLWRPPMIRAVLFDVGGPLDTEVQREAIIDRDIRAGLAREGLIVDDYAWEVAHAWAVDNFAPDLYRSVIWRFTKPNQEASNRVYEFFHSLAVDREIFELRDGIAEVLAALQARGLKLGLTANQPARVIDQLEVHGISHYFQSQAISGVYGFRKPDVRLFLRACEDLGIEPVDCIMVGDRIDNDIVPAKLLGMRTVRILTGRHRDQKPRSWDEIPDIEVEDAAGILRAIETLLAEDAR